MIGRQVMNMDKKDPNYRKKRVNRIKHAIIGIFLFLLLLPTFLCIILFIKLGRLSHELEELKYLKMQTVYAAEKSYEGQNMARAVSGSSVDVSSEDTEAAAYPDVKPEETEGTPSEYAGRVYLTFDDGPGANTEKILDILDTYGVKATFFVTGRSDSESMRLYKEIVDRGHTLGMHSYSHDYSDIYSSKSAFKKDFVKIYNTLLNATGEEPWLYRFPGGSSNSVSKVNVSELAAFLTSRNITYFDWNVQCGDAVSSPPGAKTLYKNVIDGVKEFDESVVLMHDLPEKKSTVTALPRIIKELKKENYEILPITKSTKPVQHHLS